MSSNTDIVSQACVQLSLTQESLSHELYARRSRNVLKKQRRKEEKKKIEEKKQEDRKRKNHLSDHYRKLCIRARKRNVTVRWNRSRQREPGISGRFTAVCERWSRDATNSPYAWTFVRRACTCVWAACRNLPAGVWSASPSTCNVSRTCNRWTARRNWRGCGPSSSLEQIANRTTMRPTWNPSESHPFSRRCDERAFAIASSRPGRHS